MRNVGLLQHHRPQLPRHCYPPRLVPLGLAVVGAILVLWDIAATAGRVVAVATGSDSMDVLRAEGADVVLADLRDTHAVIEAVTGLAAGLCGRRCVPGGTHNAATAPYAHARSALYLATPLSGRQ
jgi:hypothetical protein